MEYNLFTIEPVEYRKLFADNSSVEPVKDIFGIEALKFHILGYLHVAKSLT